MIRVVISPILHTTPGLRITTSCRTSQYTELLAMTSTTPADDVDAFSDNDISACDDDDFVSDTIRRAGHNEAPEEKWVFSGVK